MELSHPGSHRRCGAVLCAGAQQKLSTSPGFCEPSDPILLLSSWGSSAMGLPPVALTLLPPRCALQPQ